MQKREYSLDFLKFCLSIIIVFHHFQQVFDYVRPINFYGGLFYFGYVVEFFFLLSGFFAGKESDGRNEDIQSFKNFILHKILRLYPMALLAILAYFAIQRMIGYTRYGDATVFDLFKAVTMHAVGGPFVNALVPNNPTWFISVLIICYVWFWVIKWITKRLNVNAVYWYGALMLAGIGVIEYGINLPYFNPQIARGYMAFCWGIVFRKLYEKAEKRINRTLLLSISCVLIVGFVVIGVVDFEMLGNYQYLLVFLVYPAIIILFLQSRILNKLLNNKFSGCLGSISYEIYVWHDVFLLILDGYLWRLFIQYNDKWMIIFTLVVTLFSTFMWYFVERPVTKWIGLRLSDMEGN